jgi:LPXTG-site transpeptidase (sortase) family protein
MSFDAIGVGVAPVVDVGVEVDGEMEIPGATEVGWYRYGPVPGAEGSAVLAAHISWNGRDGVFRRLARAEPGQRFTVSFDDGAIAEYEVVAIRQYPKDQLPDELFAATGEPQVVLVTCGGSFNRSLNSYDDNIVAYAVPV